MKTTNQVTRKRKLPGAHARPTGPQWRQRWLLAMLLLAELPGRPRASEGSDQEQRAQDGATVFENVNVIPMDRERVLKNQTVVVRAGRIEQIGDAAKVKGPAQALHIDGRGKYLVPGLIDMHTHLFSDEEFPQRLAVDELAIMIANGVTTIRLMTGTPAQLVLRAKVAKGEQLGPTIYAASPQLAGQAYGKVWNGFVVTTPQQAQQAVRASKASGYDFIKLTTAITRPVYDAVIATSREEGLRVIGHVDPRVGTAHALEVGQQIEHLDSYMESVLKDDAPMKVSVSDYGVWKKPNWESLDYVDERKVIALAKATARAGVYSTPTLTFFKLCFVVPQSDAEIRARPDYRFYPEKLRERLFTAHRKFWTEPPSAERRERYQRIRNLLVKTIHDAGGKIMAGSDAPELFLVYGFTLHRELQNLVAAGLSPYAALEAATRTPAEYLKGLDTFGTIERGKRADLLLLDGNPLQDITNTERRAGVMVRGRWLPQAELRKLLDEVAERFAAAPELKSP
jgi:cytosine/adenosine deaminase-related metal-dependent hydrolase